MKIALKIVTACLIAMILITAFSSYLMARREFQLEQELHHDSAVKLGDIIRESVDLAYQTDGHQGIVNAVKTQAIETGKLRYRWVWFDVSVDDPNHPTASMDSLGTILQGKTDSVVTARNGMNELNTYYPIDVNIDESGNSRKGAVEVTGSLESAEMKSWMAIKTGLVAMAAMTIFCIAFVAWSGFRMIGRPLGKLVEQTRRIGDGDYHTPLELKTNDEFSELARALNQMSGKISEQQSRIERETTSRMATMEQLRHADRLKTVGRLAAGIAHEIGTPLNVVSGRAGLIRSGKLGPDELQESAAAIQSEANRIEAIVRQLLGFARHSPPHRTHVDIRALLERTIQLLKTIADKNRVEVSLSFEDETPFTAFVDEAQIQQVLTNILVNAIQAMPDGGNIETSLKNSEKAGPMSDQTNSNPELTSTVCIEIRDQGPGMDEETVSHIFEPFFTTKEVGQGTGLGLSIAFGIVEEHRGQIEVESSTGNGTTFRIFLPE